MQFQLLINYIYFFKFSPPPVSSCSVEHAICTWCLLHGSSVTTHILITSLWLADTSLTELGKVQTTLACEVLIDIKCPQSYVDKIPQNWRFILTLSYSRSQINLLCLIPELSIKLARFMSQNVLSYQNLWLPEEVILSQQQCWPAEWLSTLSRHEGDGCQL